jgi:hypothetical protein
MDFDMHPSTLLELQSEELENNKEIEKLQNLIEKHMWLNYLKSLEDLINNKRLKQRTRKKKRNEEEETEEDLEYLMPTINFLC